MSLLGTGTLFDSNQCSSSGKNDGRNITITQSENGRLENMLGALWSVRQARGARPTEMYSTLNYDL